MMQKRLLAMVIFCYIALVGTAFSRPLIIKNIMDEGLMKQQYQVILRFSVLLVVLVLIEEGIQILQTKLFTDLQNDIVMNLYTRVFKRLLYARMSYFSRNNTAEIINSVSTDINSIGMLVDSNLMGIMSYIFRIISGIVGLFIISWKLTILVMVIVPVKFLLVCFFSAKREVIVKQWIEESTFFSAWFDDTINGIREIKLWNLYKDKKKNMQKRQKKVLEFRKKSTLLEAYNQSADSMLQGIMVCALYGIGGYMVCGKSLSIGGLTAFITYSNYVVGPIALVFNFRFLFAQIKPSIKRLQEFFNVESEKSPGANVHIKEFKKEISFENISFSYDKDPLLRNINFKIHKGEKIAFVGDNGSGKSTLISLLLRFLDSHSGTIYMDGNDISIYNLEQYRALFGVVSQDIYLFKDTVYNNIVMDQDIENEDLLCMCKKINLQKFIDNLPEGLASNLERDGDNLSGGERQKIALIRAMVKDSPILILDEATANIDKKYDEYLYQQLLPEFHDKTVIVITHKVDSLKWIDRIYQINNHTIKECTYAELKRFSI